MDKQRDVDELLGPLALGAGVLVLFAVAFSTSFLLAPDLSSPVPGTPTSEVQDTPNASEYRTYPTHSPPLTSDETLDPSAVSVNFPRSARDGAVFEYRSHDPIVLPGDDGYFLIVQSDTGLVYQSDHLGPNASEWQPVGTISPEGAPEEGAFDTAVRAAGSYYAYQDGYVYTANRPDGDWTLRNTIHFAKDPGVHYEPSTGTFHLFYEHGYGADGHSGGKIGHATSPNGISNWTVYEPVYTPPPGYGVGDFDVVKQDGVYFLFGDYARRHPAHNVSVWVNDDLYTNFTRVGNVVGPRPGETKWYDDYGVQGAAVVYDPTTGHYVMFAHAHEGIRGPPSLHYYTGDIAVTNASR